MFAQVAGMIVVLLFCVAIGFGVWWLLIRPFTVSLEKRIPSGREYRASGAAPRKRRGIA